MRVGAEPHQRTAHELGSLIAPDLRGRRSHDLTDRSDPEIDPLAIETLLAEMTQQLVAGDTEQVRAERRRPAEPFPRFETAEKRALNEVIRSIGALVAEEPMDRIEMAFYEALTSVLVASSPAIEQS